MALALPETLTFEAIVQADATAGKLRLADCAGTVVEVMVEPGTTVKPGAEILTVTGAAYIKPQDLILALKPHPESSEHTVLEEDAIRTLKALKYAKHQIEQILTTRTVIDPLPILVPTAGVVTAPLSAGSTFNQGDTFFSFADAQIVQFEMDIEQATFIRPNKTAIIIRANEVAFSATLSSIEDSPTASSKRITMKVGKKVAKTTDPLGLGETVDVRFTFEMWERISPDTTRTQWPYQREPRGQEAGNRGFAPSAFQSKKSDRIAANPFVQPRDPRPERAISRYDIATADYKSRRHRLTVSRTEWHKRRISTIEATHRDAIERSLCQAKVTTVGASDQLLNVMSPAPGTFIASLHRPNDIIRAGDIVGRILLATEVVDAQLVYIADIPASDGQAQSIAALLRNGFTERNLSTIATTQTPITELPVFATTDGIIVEMLTSGATVDNETAVMTIHSSNMYILRTKMPETTFRTLPRVVQTDVYPPGNSKADPIWHNNTTLMTGHRISCGIAEVDLCMSVEAGQFSPGFVLQVALSDPGSALSALWLPIDCVATIGRSPEVLLHTAPGELTPFSVQVGDRIDGCFDIQSGIEPGQYVVRDLEALQALYPDVAAIMLGFWNPSAKRHH